jgi:MFS family permease
MISLTVKRWFVLVASCLVSLFIGSMYAWSVFAKPMAEYLSALSGTAVSSLTIVFTVANSVGPITMISGGYINDRTSPKFIILTGGILFGGGMFLCGFATSLWMLVLSYGLGVGLGLGLVYGCVISNVVKFFPDHRGLVGGLVTASYGISSVIIPPVANALIVTKGVTVTFKVFGVLTVVLITISSFFIIQCPPDFVPENWIQVSIGRDGKHHTINKNWKGMLSDRVFYIMLALLCCGAFTGLMVISQAAPVAQEMIGMSTAAAAIAVSILALVNTCGRIIAGFLSDKVGIVKTLLGVFILSIVGLLSLYFSGIGNTSRFYSGIFCIGLAFGAIMGIFPGFTALQFGSKHNSVNYGIMFIGFAVSGYFGPTIMSAIRASGGSYRPAFLVGLCFAVTGMILAFLLPALAAQGAGDCRGLLVPCQREEQYSCRGKNGGVDGERNPEAYDAAPAGKGGNEARGEQ